jgi:hypothetical protein
MATGSIRIRRLGARRKAVETVKQASYLTLVRRQVIRRFRPALNIESYLTYYMFDNFYDDQKEIEICSAQIAGEIIRAKQNSALPAALI